MTRLLLYRRPIILTLLALVAPDVWLLAQVPTATLTGRVLDSKTDQPLPFATVYINNSSRGTTADENGVYRLPNVPLGNQELVGSVLGYQTARLPLRLTDARLRTIDLKLEPTGQALAGVTVTARRSPAWARQFRIFSRELLGNRPQARQCHLLNPGILLFREEKGHLLAQAGEPLVIENEALGYRLHYSLLHFDYYQSKMQFAGTVRFEELKSTNARQQSQWQANRRKVYYGSLQHLLASLLAGTHEQAGYLAYRTPLMDGGNDRAMPLVRTTDRQYLNSQQAQALFRPGELPFERRLVSDQPLEIYYNRVYAANSPYHDSPYAYSLLLLPNHVLEVSTNGGITQGNGLDVRGYLGNDRLATLLPTDWAPAEEETLTATAIRSGRPARPDAGLDSLVTLRRRQYEQTAPFIYVQTDKTLYCTGDQLWLSAYVLDAARQLPVVGRAGAALQVDLVDPGGRLVQHQWLRLIDGRAAANFRLADTLRAGLYRLRAYTATNQLVSGPAFECSLTVSSLKQPDPVRPVGSLMGGSARLVTNQQPLPDSPDIQFLPEGGRWLAGVAGKLGIKVVQPNGRGRAVSGRIVDQTGVEVAPFSTNALGMGVVVLTPQPGQRYTALVSDASNNIVRSVVLPVAEPEGWALAADALSDSSHLTVRVQATGRFRQHPVYITLQSREQLVYRQKWLLPKGEAQFSVSTLTLPPGICRLTLWDSTNRPRAERLVFVPERTGGVQMRVTMDKPHHDSREQVVIGLQFRDADGYPVTGSWSAAVTDADQLPADTNRPDLRTYLLLTGGLRGEVESPAYYAEPEHLADLDNLLLTQGWRRLPAPQPADSTGGWSLSGRVRDGRGRPVTQKTVLVVLEQGDQKMLRSVATDAVGVFRVGGLLLTDTVQVRARVLDAGAVEPILTIDTAEETRTLPAPALPSQPLPDGYLTAARTRQLAWPAFYRDSTARQLAEVIVRATKPKPERPLDVQRASLHGDADGVLVVDRNVALSVGTVSDLILRLPGVIKMGDAIRIRGFSSFGDSSPLYLIDGTSADKQTVDNLNPLEISRIELLKNGTTAGMYGARGANGVIAVYTVKGNHDELTAPSSVSATVVGFATPREFYVPRYEPMTVDATPKDRRDVLFWQPLGQSDSDGLARLLFPLSDTAKRLRVIIQGITTEGVPMSFSWELPVR